MPDDDRKFTAGAFAKLDQLITDQFTAGINHGIRVGRQSAAAALEYAGHHQAAAIVRFINDCPDDLPARIRHTANELEYYSDLNELPPGWAWTPDTLRAEADRLEANP